jgi:hypothetical protein
MAASIRLWFNFVLHPPARHLWSDMGTYDQRARHLLGGTLGPWDTFTPPGYPALLALLRGLTGETWSTALAALQTALGVAVVWLVWRLARRATRSHRVALGVAIAAALHVPFVFYGGLVLTELPCAFLLLLAAELACRARSGRWAPTIGVGLALGYAVTVRVNVAPFVGALTVAAAFAGTPRSRWLGWLAIAALPVLVVVAHHTRIMGKPTGVATNGGLNFYLNVAPVREVEFWEGSFRHWTRPLPNHYRHRAVERQTRPFYDDAHYYRRGLERLREAPLRTALAALDNFPETAGIGRQDYWPWLPPQQPQVLKPYARAFGWIVVTPAALAALYYLARFRELARERLALAVATGGLAALALASYLFLGDPRLRVPFDGFVLIVLATAARDLWLRWAGPRRALATPRSPGSGTIDEQSPVSFAN